MPTSNDLIERLRSLDKTTFTVAFRGYDRIAVHEYLGVLSAYGQDLSGRVSSGAGPVGGPSFPPVPRFPVVFRGYLRREVDDLITSLQDQLRHIG